MHSLCWLKASLLEAGMILLDRNNGELEVVSQHLIPNRLETVYNIEVEGFHTYHVGRLGTWVHNANCCDVRNGAGDRVNMVPQASTLNRGDWKAMENSLRSELEAGKTVSIKVDVGYANGNSSRPSSFFVIAKIDGKPKEWEFEQ